MTVQLNLRLLKALRETHSKSISDVAEYLGYKTPTSVWLIEKGQRNLSIEGLYKLSKLYKQSMEDFLIVK